MKKSESVFLNEKVAKKLFKNEKYGKALSSRVISDLLDMPYEYVYNNIKPSTDEIAFSSLTVNSTADAIYYDNENYINIELNFYRSDSKIRQLDSYVYQLYLGQLHTYKDYYKIKKITQISIDSFDYFGHKEFMYNVYFMEEKYHEIDNKNVHKIHLNLDYLHQKDYNEIMENKLMRDLYFLTCSDNEILDVVYEEDDFMKKIIDEAKKIAGTEKMDLYLTDEELLQKDQEHYYNLGLNDGISQNKREIILNMLKENLSLETISKYTNQENNELKNQLLILSKQLDELEK